MFGVRRSSRSESSRGGDDLRLSRSRGCGSHGAVELAGASDGRGAWVRGAFAQMVADGALEWSFAADVVAVAGAFWTGFGLLLLLLLLEVLGHGPVSSRLVGADWVWMARARQEAAGWCGGCGDDGVAFGPAVEGVRDDLAVGRADFLGRDGLYVG